VSLGWCSYAAVWLSRVPALIPGHFIAVRSTGAVREVYARQAAADWETFLSLRASELIPGGRLLVVLPGVNDEGITGFETLFDQANWTLADLVDKGAIAAEERTRMALGAYARRRSELFAPFDRNGCFQGLRVERYELFKFPDAAWVDYNGHGRVEVLAARQAQFFRSAFLPTLACALRRADEAEACAVFGDRLEERLRQRIASQPSPLDSFVQTIVLEKESTANWKTSETSHEFNRVSA